METFGICYLVFGLIALAGCVLDADEPRQFIHDFPKRKTDYICEFMYKYILEHRPSYIQKIDFGPSPITDIPKDRVYDFTFRMSEQEVDVFRQIPEEQIASYLRNGGYLPVGGQSQYVELEKHIREVVRRKFYNEILNFVSIRVSFCPGGGIEVNTELVCRRPTEPRFAWATKNEMFLTSNRFER